MLIAGLTGGMACGKTAVAQTLRDLGCHIVEADALGHQAMQPQGEAYDQVVLAFGTSILNRDGSIDRQRLAAIVFQNSAALQQLNAIVHPAVRELLSRQIREIRERDPQAIVIYVAAILIETGGYREFDRLIVVSCTREQQIERALQRPNATMADVLARLDHQLPIEKKKGFADYVINAGGPIEDTVRQTKMVYDDLRKLAS